MISTACPKCHKRYRLDDKLAGKRAKCKECGEVIEIPRSLASEEAYPPLSDPRITPSALPGTESQTPEVPAPPLMAYPAATAAVPRPANAPRVAGIGLAGIGPPLRSASAVPSDSPLSPAVRDDLRGASQTLRGTTSHLKYEISQRPDFSIVKVEIAQGKKIFAEPSAMVSMTPSMHLEAGLKGGIGKTFGRLLGGESLIINTFTAQNGPGEVMFAGGAAGDVAYHRLEGNTLYLQRGAYMLNSEGVEVSGKWQGAKGFFSGEGLVLLKATGTGDIFFNSYGAIIPIDVTDGFIVDTGYIVAFEESLQYRVTVLPGLRTAGKVKSFFFGGEGLVCQFAGTGRVWIQTRQVKSYLSWVHNFRPVKSN